MASEREPGWYWVHARTDSESWCVAMVGESGLVHTPGSWMGYEQSRIHEWGPRIYPPDAERPDASLRDRLGALADAMEERRTKLMREEAGRSHGKRATKELADWIPQIRALLRTEWQPPAKGDE
jgi:hypothetical protein